MAITLRCLTGEDEAAFAEGAACGMPVLALVAELAARAAARDGAAAGEPASLTLGEVQDAALGLRAASIEGPLQVGFSCTACGERLDVPLDPGGLVSGGATVSDRAQACEIEGIAFSFRLATVADVLAAAAAGAAAGLALLERCVTATDASGTSIALHALPEQVLDRAAAELLARDPRAETVLSCTCPSCGAGLEAVLDPAQFLAAELAARSSSLSVEVLAIAARTGWTEQAILAMPRHRRRGYAAALGAA